MFSRGGTLLPSIYADARYIDAVIVSQASFPTRKSSSSSRRRKSSGAGRPRSSSNASSHPPLPPAQTPSAAIEIEHVQYLGHMEVITSKVADLAVNCEQMLGRLVGTSPATIAVRHNVVEFLHPQSKQVAKWFLMSSIEWLHVCNEKITMVVTRGKLPSLRFFCYAFHAESDAQAKQLSMIILTGVKAWRRQMIRRFEESATSSGASRALREVLASTGDCEDRLQGVLQHEIDYMKEEFRAITIKRFRLQKLHLKTEAEQNRGMLALLLHMYDSCKASEITGKGARKGVKQGFLQKSLDLSSHLASSLESLINPSESSSSRPKKSSVSSPQRSGSKSGSRDKLNKKEAAAAARAAKEKKPFRQALFKSVTGKAPRPNTPGRRGSQAFFLAVEKTRKMTSNSRRDLIRGLWHKALQQTLMLIRMAKQNARLDAIAAESAAQAKEVATAAHKLTLRKLWEPIWATPPVAWAEEELRKCIRDGVPDESRGTYLDCGGGWGGERGGIHTIYKWLGHRSLSCQYRCNAKQTIFSGSSDLSISLHC